MKLKNLSQTLAGSVLALCYLLTPQAAAGVPAEFDQGIRDFTDEMIDKHGFERTWLEPLLANARYQQEIIDAITRPYEARPWYEYRPLFVTTANAEKGIAFWDDHKATLERASEEYGVPPEIIVAIIGVETRYGKNTGRHSVLDALATLAFGYPGRAGFFRKQLEEFLLLQQEESLDGASMKGSYAGAIGIPQFIPSSYRDFAVDFDDDGVRDLNNPADAIGSVGNYFKEHGWKEGELIAVAAQATGKDYDMYANYDLKPNASVKELQEAEVSTEESLSPDLQAALLQFDAEDKDELWLGFHNFYVITRYNHSALYAMAVFQLSQKVRSLRQEQLQQAAGG
jgi:membrane-bound lytic murein transglycosylase B